jgi:hypothetical protein
MKDIRLFLHGTDQKAIRVSNRKFTFLSLTSLEGIYLPYLQIIEEVLTEAIYIARARTRRYVV